MPDRPEPVTLEGRLVALRPLAPAHRDGLADAARDGELWRLPYTAVPHPDRTEAEIRRRLGLQRDGTVLPFTVFDAATGRIVGMTSLLDIDLAVPALEIGSTWYARAAQRTGLNTEAKALLLRHAFETLGCASVRFLTHVLNHPSRRAIERLGARHDGTLRAHRRMPDGTLRDSALYSIVAAEWPAIRAHLAFQLDRPR